MSHPAIRVEGLWKEYSIGAQSLAGQTFRESLMASVQRPWQRVTGRGEAVQGEEHFWALKDVSFEVQPGEVVGIIGRNGAGKSTLLKILSRITAPTKGCVEIRGRVASLLEVGTGFHQELTGRENIRLNAAILGMSSAEVARKFDEIVDFSGVEKFIDTPVKRYSSGMQVRLAFAVAAHLEPEILIIDEVLAVGDAEFQKKCLGKMGEISGKGGRTVVFVSHQIGLIARLCNRGILLNGGKMQFSGDSSTAVDRYLSLASRRRSGPATDDSRYAKLDAAIAFVDLLGEEGTPTDQIRWDEALTIKVGLKLLRPTRGMLLGVALDSDRNGRVTTWIANLDTHFSVLSDSKEIILSITRGMIAPGRFSLSVALTESDLPFFISWKENARLLCWTPARRWRHTVRTIMVWHLFLAVSR